MCQVMMGLSCAVMLWRLHVRCCTYANACTAAPAEMCACTPLRCVQAKKCARHHTPPAVLPVGLEPIVTCTLAVCAQWLVPQCLRVTCLQGSTV